MDRKAFNSIKETILQDEIGNAFVFGYGILFPHLMSFALAHQSKTDKTGDAKTSIPAKHISSSKQHHRINNLNGNDSPDSILYLQRAIGNQAVQRLMRSSSNTEGEFDFAKINILQPKLTVNQPGDESEREADRMAEQVMRISVPKNTINSSASNDEENIARKCATCETEEEEEEKMKISRKPSAKSNLEASNEISDEINTIRSSGNSPLDASTKDFMESRFGFDFSNVRVHTGEMAAKSAQSINALAYTVGDDIVFDSGYYQTTSLEGRRLLAHELTHVVQQTGLAGADTLGLDPPGSPTKHNVDHVASELGKVPIVQMAQVSVQRQPKPDDTEPRNTGPPLPELPPIKGCSLIWEDGMLKWKCEGIPVIGSTPAIPVDPRKIPGEIEKHIPKEPSSKPPTPLPPPPQGPGLPPNWRLPPNWLEEVCRRNPMSPLCIPLGGEKSPGQLRPPDSLTKPTGVFWTWDVLFENDHPSSKESAPNGGMTADGTATMETIKFLLKGDPTLQVRLIGHASSEGDTAHNIELSKRRVRMIYGRLDEAKLGGQVINPIKSDGKTEGCTRLEPGLWACGELRATSKETRPEERKVEVTFLRNEPLPGASLRLTLPQFGRTQTE